MRADARANNRDILVAASELMREHGPEVSLRAVAQRAGVGVATLYRHFPTRRDLLVAVLDQLVERLRALASTFHEGPTSIEVRWGAFVRGLADLNLTAVTISIREVIVMDDSPHRDLALEREAVIVGLVEEVVAVAREGRLVREDVTGIQFLVGLLVVARPLVPQVEEYVVGQQAWLHDVYLRGMRP